MRSVLLLFFILISNVLIGEINSMKSDTSKSLSLSSYLKLIAQNHPVFESFSIQKTIAKSQFNQAKTGIDPILQFEEKEKQLKGQNYYSIQSAQIILPTLSPIQLSAGSETNNGNYVNPENSTNSNQLNYAGLELSILKNLLFDKRRLDLAKGKNNIQFTEFQIETQKMDLVQKAAQDYINWYSAYKQVKLWDSAVLNVKLRMDATRKLFKSESLNVADTLESYLQYQSFLSKLNDAQIAETKFRWIIAGNLWNKLQAKEGIIYQAVELKNDVIPEDPFTEFWAIGSEISLLNPIDGLPEIGQSKNKIEAINLELKLRKNNLLPKLDFKYQLINSSFQPNAQNYRMGLSFSTPIFLFQSRNELKEFKSRKRDSEIQLDIKMRELSTKRNSTVEQISTTKALYLNQLSIEKGMKQLLDFESSKFALGESNIFILNSRETRLWETKIKTIETQNKFSLNYTDYLRLNGEILNFFKIH